MELIEQAKALASKGYHVFPIHLSKKDDGKKDVRPLGGGWRGTCTADPEAVEDLSWVDHLGYQATHIGIACEESGIAVIDLDPTEDEEDEERGIYVPGVSGDELLVEWLHRFPETEDDDATAIETDRGGVHIFYRNNPEHPAGSTVKKVAPFVDTRGIGGMVIAWDPDSLPELAQLPVIPAYIAEKAKVDEEGLTDKGPKRDPRYAEGQDGTSYGLRALEGETHRIRESWARDEGTFNHDLNRAAFAVGQLVAGGELEESHAYGTLADLLVELGGSSELKTLDSGFWAGHARPRSSADEEHGGEVSPAQMDEMMYRFLTVEGLKNLPKPQWLLEGWLVRNSVAQLVGPSGCGKSWVLVDWAGCVSRGLSWPERKEASYLPGRVAFIVAEGAHGLSQRVQAWEEKFGPMGPVIFLPMPIQIKKESSEWQIFVATLKRWKADLIFFDTQARCTLGVKENDAMEMGLVIDTLEQLRMETKACVLPVHHTGKGENPSARGSTAVIGALETEIMVMPARGGVKRIKNTKQKNAPEAESLIFDLEPVGDSAVIKFLGNDVSERDKDNIETSQYRMMVRQALREDPGAWFTAAKLMELGELKSRSRLGKVLEQLEEGGWVQSKTAPPNGQGGRPPKLYAATAKLGGGEPED